MAVFQKGHGHAWTALGKIMFATKVAATGNKSMSVPIRNIRTMDAEARIEA